MKPAIRIDNLSKEYKLGARQFGGYRTLRESLVEAVKAPWRALTRAGRPPAAAPADQTLWALDKVSFDVMPGEVVGLIGRNGAGKSTLLKVLSRITEPSSGRVELRGRVGSLLEVGTGFHPELTGRENIYLNGSILGMGRGEIARKFDEIVSFAEMDRFLDTPVKRYSSGMYVRLAFAVAAHLDLEVLLVDEVLAVGDLEFQKKCLARMGSIAESGRTVIFVSHNLGLIHRLCGQVVMMKQGRLHAKGATAEVIQTYLAEGLDHDGEWHRPAGLAKTRDVAVTYAAVLNPDGKVSGVIHADEEVRLLLEYEVRVPTPNFEVGFTLRNSEGVNVVVSLDSDTGDWPERARPVGRYRSICKVPKNFLAPGTYFLTFAAHIINQTTFEHHPDVMAFEVSETGCIRAKRNDRRLGVVMPIFDWTIEKVS